MPTAGKRVDESFHDGGGKRIRRNSEEDHDYDRLRSDLKSGNPELGIRALQELLDIDPIISQELMVYILQIVKDSASGSEGTPTILRLLQRWPFKVDHNLVQNFQFIGGVHFLADCLRKFANSEGPEPGLALSLLHRLTGVPKATEEITKSLPLIVPYLESSHEIKCRKLINVLSKLSEGSSFLSKPDVLGKLLLNHETDPQTWTLIARILKTADSTWNVPNTLLRHLKEAILGTESTPEAQSGALYLIRALVQFHPRFQSHLCTSDVVDRLLALASESQPLLQLKALAILNAIFDSAGEELMNEAVINAVVSLLRFTETKVKIKVLRLLCQLIDHPHCIPALVSSGYLESLVEQLRPSTGMLDVVLPLLVKLAHSSEFRTLPCLNSIVPYLLSFLEPNFRTSIAEEYRHLTVQVLLALVSHESPEIKNLVSGSLHLALNLVATGSPQIVRTALLLVANLCHNCEVTRVKLLEAGVIELLLPLMDSPDSGLRQGAVAALWSLTYSTLTAGPLRRANGLPLLLHLLSSPAKKIQGFALGCLRNLSHDSSCKIDIVDLQGLRPIVALLAHPAERVREGAIGTLWNLSSAPSNDTAFLRDLPVPLLLRFLESTDNLKIFNAVLNVLKNLLSSRDNPISQPLAFAFLQEGGVPVLKLHKAVANSGLNSEKVEEIEAKIDHLVRSLLEHRDMLYLILNSDCFPFRVAAAVTISLHIPHFAPLAVLDSEGTLDKIFETFRTALSGPKPAKLLHVISGLQSLSKSAGPLEVILEPLKGSPAIFTELFNSPKFSDVQFLIEGRTIYAHKLALSFASLYFENMFTIEMRESQSNVVKIPDKSFKTFSKVIQSCYVGAVELESLEEAIDVLVAADQYLLEHLRRQCEAFIAEKITLESFEAVLVFARQFSFQNLIASCLEWVLGQASNFLEDFDAPLLSDLSLVDFVESKVRKALKATLIS